MCKVKAREVYEEAKGVGGFEVIGRVTSFTQGWRTRYAVTVTKYDEDTDWLYYFVDTLMAHPSSDAEAVRHCIAAIDECVAQIERMQPQPEVEPVDTNEPPF